MSEETNPWPKVTANDHGIRPAGPADACFYCRSNVGEEHSRNCVTIGKLVKMRYTYEIEVMKPHYFSPDQCEYQNCADNSVLDVRAYLERLEAESSCMCLGENRFEAEFLGVVDDTPRKMVEDDAGVEEAFGG